MGNRIAPVNLHPVTTRPETRLSLEELLEASVSLSRIARWNRREGIVHAGQNRFGRLGLIGAGWELLSIESRDRATQTFLVTQEVDRAERFDSAQERQTIGLATLSPLSSTDTPEVIGGLQGHASVRLDHWLAPEQRNNRWVNARVAAALLEAARPYTEEVVWAASRMQDIGRYDGMYDAGLQAVERPRMYPELGEEGRIPLQLWKRDYPQL